MAASDPKVSGARFTAPGMSEDAGTAVAVILQDRLHALNDLALILKHVHWNVIGPNFIGVHTMLDPQVDAVRQMVDETAERIAVLGGSPVGTAGSIVRARTGKDYEVGRADALTHLAALDQVYSDVVEGHRRCLDEVGELDLVTQDLVIEQAQNLELFQWFVRAHLENATGW